MSIIPFKGLFWQPYTATDDITGRPILLPKLNVMATVVPLNFYSTYLLVVSNIINTNFKILWCCYSSHVLRPLQLHPQLVRSYNVVFFLTCVMILGNTNPPLKSHNTWKCRKSECWPRERLHAVSHAKWVVTLEKPNSNTVRCSGHKCPQTQRHTFKMDSFKFHWIGGDHFAAVTQSTRGAWPVYCLPLERMCIRYLNYLWSLQADAYNVR
jgi:hypothetical protein